MLEHHRMNWSLCHILTILCIAMHQDVVQACDAGCQEDLIQQFGDLLDTKLNAKMEQINLELTTFKTELNDKMEKINSKLTSVKTELTDEFGNILEKRLNFKFGLQLEELEVHLSSKLDNISEAISTKLDINEVRRNESHGILLHSIKGICLSTECFLLYTDRVRTWREAYIKCEEEGHILAQPSDAVAVALQKQLAKTY
ncbi:unnamed protein product, partial [Meganyctiphanes norvegica]